VSWYQKGKTNLDFTEARDSEWQWHQPGHMQVCTLFQTDNHASTPPLSCLQAGCPSCRPTNSVKALKHRLSYKVASDGGGYLAVWRLRGVHLVDTDNQLLDSERECQQRVFTSLSVLRDARLKLTSSSSHH